MRGQVRKTGAIGRAVVAVAAIVSGVPGAAQTAPPSAPLAPFGKWGIEYHPSMCVLTRPYGTPEQAKLLGMRTATSESTFTLLTVDPAGDNRRSRTGKVTVAADGAVLAARQAYQSRVAPTSNQRIDTTELPRTILPQLAAAKTVTLTYDGGRTVAFALAGTGKALAAMTACENDLMISWGFDPAEQARVAARAIGNPGAAFDTASYPSAAYDAGVSGRVVTVLDIGADGKVRGCRVVVSSKNESLDTGTCRIAERRLTYKPARDAAGAAIASKAYLAVNWVID